MTVKSMKIKSKNSSSINKNVVIKTVFVKAEPKEGEKEVSVTLDGFKINMKMKK